MNRKVYITDGTISLSEYINALDALDFYDCWRDEATQQGYNHQASESFAELHARPIRARFISTIIRCSDGARIGTIFVSPENTAPDLAIMLGRDYRHQGYGAAAFALGVQHCQQRLGLAEIYAGCYPHNFASLNMLKKCGFQPHPQGNQAEKHYLTGEPITQYGFVRRLQ